MDIENKIMKILIINNTASTGWNLKLGLEKLYTIKVDIIFEEKPFLSGKSNKITSLLNPKEYDAVFYIYPFISNIFKPEINQYIKNAKILICSWCGTDLRGKTFKNQIKNGIYNLLHNYYKNQMFSRADYHYYSTFDLAWWLQNIPNNKKQHLFQAIDTELFKQTKQKVKGTIKFVGGAKSFEKHKIPHDQFPSYISIFSDAIIIPAEGLDVNTIQTIHLECAACNVKLQYHKWLNRNFVIKYASKEVIAKKVYKKIKELQKIKRG